MPLPQFQGPFVAYGQATHDFQFKIKAVGVPPVTSYGVVGSLPDGLSLSVTTGQVTGTPTALGVGTFIIPFTASNTDGTSQADFTFNIFAAAVPFYIGVPQIQIDVGTAVSLAMQWTNTPTSYAMTTVPPGLTFNTTTGLLSGMPTTMGKTKTLIHATNGSGTGENFFTVTVTDTGSADVPVITSPGTASGQVGVNFLYQITATNSPTSFDASPLQPGMIFKPNGQIQWQPAAAGVFSLIISADNDAGHGFKTLTITIAPADGGGGGGGGGGGEPPPPEIPPLTTIPGGITYGIAKGSIATVTDNGVDPSDPRVMRRTNEAINELLITTDPRTGAALIPVNCMAKWDVRVDKDGYLLLPKELENAIEAQVVVGDAYTDRNISQGWTNLLTPMTYLDPSQTHDNPLEDFGLVPDPNDGATLRRKMRYPGLSAEALVRITGKKRFILITKDTDFLIIQNVPAIKLAIQAIEFRENSDPENGKLYWDWAVKLLSDEVVNHRMDPTNYARRRAVYEQDLINFPEYSLGWTVAMIATNLPDAQMMGRLDLYRLVQRAEMRAMWMGTWKGCLEEFDAEVFAGEVFLPHRVESALAISMNGMPIQIRSIFFNYLENAEGWDCSCGGYVRDLGEARLGGIMRRKFRVGGSITTSQCLRMVCKLRWVQKKPADVMTIRCLDAIQLLCEWQLYRKAGQINEAREAQDEAVACLDGQLSEYLKGIKHTLPVNPHTVGLNLIGEYL